MHADMVPDYTMQGLLREQADAVERALSFSEDIGCRLREIQSFNRSITACFHESGTVDNSAPLPPLPSSLLPVAKTAERQVHAQRVPLLDRLPGGCPVDESFSSPLCQPLLSYRTPDFPRVPRSALSKVQPLAVTQPKLEQAALPDGFAELPRSPEEAQLQLRSIEAQLEEAELPLGCVEGVLRKKNTQLFPSPSADTKRRVCDSLQRKVYNVEDYYYETGLAQFIARHSNFHNATLVVILVNTVWLAVDTDLNKADLLSEAPWPFQVVDNVFCTFFTFELVTRFCSFQVKTNSLRDAWFSFDVLLVGLMIWETWIQPSMFALTGIKMGSDDVRSSSILRVFRVFRLARVARMARLLRAIPELLILVESMAVAIRSVFATLVLLIIVIYIFALVFTQLLSGTPAGSEGFETVPSSMQTLMIQVTCGFDGDLVTKLLVSGVLNYVVFLVYMLVANLTIMNMLVGVLVEVVADVSQQNKEDNFLHSMQEQITHMVNTLDKDGSGSISKAEFDEMVETPEMMADLRDLGVDVIAFVEFTHFVFRDPDKSLSAIEFFDLVIQFRGSKQVTVKDVVDMRRFVSMELQHLENKLLEDLKATPLAQLAAPPVAAPKTAAPPPEEAPAPGAEAVPEMAAEPRQQIASTEEQLAMVANVMARTGVTQEAAVKALKKNAWHGSRAIRALQGAGKA